ncbi:unnamed protein product [Amoebophrya sp. A25]|nr:unnamed protein product [Amoebophrya sp. A25]|eukprot:GSA25T00025683001.1
MATVWGWGTLSVDQNGNHILKMANSEKEQLKAKPTNDPEASGLVMGVARSEWEASSEDFRFFAPEQFPSTSTGSSTINGAFCAETPNGQNVPGFPSMMPGVTTYNGTPYNPDAQQQGFGTVGGGAGGSSPGQHRGSSRKNSKTGRSDPGVPGVGVGSGMVDPTSATLLGTNCKVSTTWNGGNSPNHVSAPQKGFASRIKKKMEGASPIVNQYRAGGGFSPVAPTS